MSETDIKSRLEFLENELRRLDIIMNMKTNEDMINNLMKDAEARIRQNKTDI